MSDNTLVPTVLTSSSQLSLQELFGELEETANLHDYEIFLLRDRDINDLCAVGGFSDDIRADPTKPNLRDILSIPEHVDVVVRWLKDLRTRHGVRYRALATYLPDISSFHEDRFKKAKAALVNVGKIAASLDVSVIEIVAGTLLDACSCKACATDSTSLEGPTVHLASFKAKAKRLLDGMKEVVDRTTDVRYAIEMEPGPAYVLNEQARLDSGNGVPERIPLRIERLAAMICANSLTERIGFNIDIGHMRIGNISAAAVERALGPSCSDLILNAHISDSPRTHTRDQALGTWTPVSIALPSPYDEYLKLLEKAQRQGGPFTGAVSIEHEGCGDLNWVKESLMQLRYLCKRLSTTV